MKGDYTRTRKRNLQGVVNDGINSLTRFYLNYFKDAERQVYIPCSMIIVHTLLTGI